MAKIRDDKSVLDITPWRDYTSHKQLGFKRCYDMEYANSDFAQAYVVELYIDNDDGKPCIEFYAVQPQYPNLPVQFTGGCYYVKTLLPYLDDYLDQVLSLDYGIKFWSINCKDLHDILIDVVGYLGTISY